MQGCKLKQDKILLFKQVSDISYSNFGYVSGSTIFLRLANSANSFLTKLYLTGFVILCFVEVPKVKSICAGNLNCL